MVVLKVSVALCGLLGVTQAFGPAARSIVHSTLVERGGDLMPEYDYVIVGGGTAGLTVADRLTENGKNSVLVIEVGTFQNGTAVTTVGMGFFGITDPTLFFNYSSAPQPGLNGRRIDVIAGQILGGSSGVNGFQVHRGQKEDYDRWASYFGRKTSWGWDDVLPYFKKAWHFHPPSKALAKQHDIKYDDKYWGKTSNIHASWPTFLWPSLKSMMSSIGEIAGVTYPPDSGAGLPGAFWYPHSADPGPVLRSFARTGHWDGIEAARKNYHTLTGHRVLKVTFDKKGKAIGASYVPTGATSLASARSVKAKKEVIVAAGTLNTPKILQASGVGPKKLLRDAGIDVVVDLPGVGSNFQDHPFQVGAFFNFTNFPFHPDVNDFFENSTFLAEAQAEFEANRTGALTIASGNCGAFLPMGVIAPDTFKDIARRYEAQDPAAHLPAGTDKTVIAGYQAQKKALAAAIRSKGSAFYNFFFRGGYSEGAIVYLHPLSRGSVNINTADPYFSPPVVDYRALSNPSDGDILVEFVRFTRRYFQQTSLKKFNPVELSPGAHITSPADIIADVRNRMIPSTFHPVGTAAMMPRELGGVVDENLLVYGVKGVSVVDASIMPDLPGAYTQQTTYAFAEKAADIIKSRS
ncbi:GMC oxidoreductase-like protein [Immersiella caudata]|uniref:GMC oxidoreductase-like protein n=1 Tax=Immersiella caudata TaxID=314043 RepID=A0AA39WKD8_9PEZI|nr:GMC oxidoreductase-like protein [Immersiella caudata]